MAFLLPVSAASWSENLVLPIRSASCAVMLTRLCPARTPASDNNSANNLATVVFPVPGFPGGGQGR